MGLASFLRAIAAALDPQPLITVTGGSFSMFSIPCDTPDLTFTIPEPKVVIKDTEGNKVTAGFKEVIESDNPDALHVLGFNRESRDCVVRVGSPGVAVLRHVVIAGNARVTVSEHPPVRVTTGTIDQVEVSGDPFNLPGIVPDTEMFAADASEVLLGDTDGELSAGVQPIEPLPIGTVMGDFGPELILPAELEAPLAETPVEPAPPETPVE